jgi:predicted cupin superfamily sugar epimerase
MNQDAQNWVNKLDLQKHPEGGYFKEIYRSEETISAEGLPVRYNEERNFGTSIYFLLPGTEFSAFHRLKTDEIWHFYHGSSLTIHIINKEGNYIQKKLGPNWEQNEHFQVLLPARNWFGAMVNNPNSYTLMGCTLAPGFDFRDFELGIQENLLNLYPQYSSIIKALTRTGKNS